MRTLLIFPSGAHGYLEITHDITKYCKASVFGTIGKKTPCFVRFSTVGGESGSADTARDPRGFAMKFYTDEGNWDLVGNNTPIFFIRDPIFFPSFIHTQKRNPKTHMKDPDMFWDFPLTAPRVLPPVLVPLCWPWHSWWIPSHERLRQPHLQAGECCKGGGLLQVPLQGQQNYHHWQFRDIMT